MSALGESKRESAPAAELPSAHTKLPELAPPPPPPPSHTDAEESHTACAGCAPGLCRGRRCAAPVEPTVESTVRTVETFYKGTAIVCTRTTYLGGIPHGPETWFGRDGKVQSTAMNRNGLRDGLSKLIDDSGVAELTYEFIGDEVVSVRQPGYGPFGSHESKLHRPPVLLDDQGRDFVLPLGEVTVYTTLEAEAVPLYAELLVPAEARRVTPMQAPGRFTSRVNRARVMRIFDRLGREHESGVSLTNDQRLVFAVKKDVFPDLYSGTVTSPDDFGIVVVRYLEHCHQLTKRPDPPK